ncbi:hypothetical protein FS749_014131 [Ceratobasidium sp. UAMH 11750]|nr:hypothetical protein FS749_014131 [Ceratobasidium sp. UAMH 11750]
MTPKSIALPLPFTSSAAATALASSGAGSSTGTSNSADSTGATGEAGRGDELRSAKFWGGGSVSQATGPVALLLVVEGEDETIEAAYELEPEPEA